MKTRSTCTPSSSSDSARIRVVIEVSDDRAVEEPPLPTPRPVEDVTFRA